MQNERATEFDICKMITISSAHITEETAKALDKEPVTNKYGLSVYNKSDYGWFIYLPENIRKSDDKESSEEETLPKDLKACIKFADNKECEWLCIDFDGPEVDLPIYEW